MQGIFKYQRWPLLLVKYLRLLSFIIITFLFPSQVFPLNISSLPVTELISDNTTNKELLRLVFVKGDSSLSDSDVMRIVFLTKTLKNTAPFDEFFDLISVWRVELSPEERLIFFRHNDRPPYMSIRQDFLNDLAERINGPFKLIVMNDHGSVAYAEMSSMIELLSSY